jgi:hypothetical protein
VKAAPTDDGPAWRPLADGGLRLRREQLDSFHELLVADFRLRMERQLRRVHPERMDAVGTVMADGLIRRAMDRAAGYGLRTERTIALYVHLCVGLGWDFESRPECRELAQVLNEPTGENAKIYLAYRCVPPTLRRRPNPGTHDDV